MSHPLTNQLLLNLSPDISWPQEARPALDHLCGCRGITTVMCAEPSGLRLTDEMSLESCVLTGRTPTLHSSLHFNTTEILNHTKASGTHPTRGMKANLDKIRGNASYVRKKEFNRGCPLHQSCTDLEETLPSEP